MSVGCRRIGEELGTGVRVMSVGCRRIGEELGTGVRVMSVGCTRIGEELGTGVRVADKISGCFNINWHFYAAVINTILQE
jgi:hypothetical protein